MQVLTPWTSTEVVGDSLWWSWGEEGAWVQLMRDAPLTQIAHVHGPTLYNVYRHGEAARNSHNPQWNGDHTCGIEFQAVVASPARSTPVFGKAVLNYPNLGSTGLGESDARERGHGFRHGPRAWHRNCPTLCGAAPLTSSRREPPRRGGHDTRDQVRP